ncbi:glycosyltransferase [Treponema zuelzerae]|uniref:Glycosyltransferase n=1 Tax=Teretinema zuelzerae TaxID=156 RepID=A0AAE3JIT4_9SPIR|nr:glycosyltransferase [Teretinema zuelzerae]MCD1654658.1 glycosyltransferase [Teretinema zuelzerae]
MRTAMIVNSFPEISEKFLLNQVISLIDADVDITVVASLKPSSSMRHDIFDKHHVEDKVTYLNIPRSLKKRIPGTIFRFIKLLVSSPATAFRCFDSSKYGTAAKNGKLIWFAADFPKNTYDIVHCHFGPNGLIGAFLKDSGYVRSLIVTFHGSDINSYPARYGEGVYRWMYERADMITVNTSFTGGKVAVNGCSPDKIRVLPVGLITTEYDGIRKKDPDAFALLTVGRLVEKKGHEYMLKALPAICKRFPDVRWYVAGSGHLEGVLIKMAAELGVAESVVFLGQCDNEAVKDLYSRAAVFILPSVTAPDGDMEGQGLVLQEAQYCGIPVVSTLHNGIPDGVKDGITGFLVPEKDSSALAQAVCDLLENPEKARNMGEKGIAFVGSAYDTRILAATLKNWYHELESISN